MQPFELPDGAGYVKVKIGDVEREIDMYQVWSQLDQIRAETESEPAQVYWDRVKQLLVGLGFPPNMSQFAANRFALWHDAVVRDLGKAGPGESRPDSPGSTEPPSSTSPPASS